LAKKNKSFSIRIKQRIFKESARPLSDLSGTTCLLWFFVLIIDGMFIGQHALMQDTRN